MKVVILSKIDYAGSAYKLCEALLMHTDIEVNLFSGKPENNPNHPTKNIIDPNVLKEAQRAVNEADIIHFKGDWAIENGYLGLQIPYKPIVITTSGSFFRKKEHGGLGVYNASHYSRAKLKTSFEPDLLYPEYSDIWTPHPIDSDDKPNIWKQTSDPFFLHIPSSPNIKGTQFVSEVFNILKRRIKCQTQIISGIDFKRSCELKKNATMYFDQFVVGFYGNSALEAMQWGIPVVNWISLTAIEQAKGKLDNCPIVNRSQASPERTADKVIEMMDDITLSEKTKKWCDSIHGYKAVAKQWVKLYKSIL